MNALACTAALLVVAAVAVSCTTIGASSGGDTSTRVRCLSDPGPGAPGTATDRPLFFLFCAQSP